jgi:peroxiredoxin
MQIDSSVQNTPFYKKIWFWGSLIGLVLLFGGMLISYTRFIQLTNISDAGILNAAPIAGHPAPDFTLQTIDNQTIRLSDFKGKLVLVNFWATWCAPCRTEFPDFQEAAVDNADKLVIIGVNNTTTDQPDRVAEFIKEFGITFPIVLDETGEVGKAYQIFGLPTSVFIDKDGIIVETFTGPINKAYIEAKISDM